MPKEYDISKAFKRIENDLIDSMMRNMKRHQVEEAQLGIQWEQWQALQLQELERFKAENKDLFTERFDDLNDAIDDLFYATYRDARAAEEHRIIDRIKKGDFTPPEDKGGFFGLNEAKLKALLVATRSDMVRAEFALLRRANDQYRHIIFDSMAYANVTNDYKKAVDMATKDFLRSGINCVQYKNGARHTIESYASMAIRTGNKRAYLMGEGEAHDRYGIHTVRVNKRPDACPKCVAFLGRILVDDVYGGGTQAEATKLGVPTLSDAMLSGFLHPNCKDTYSAYIEGVSKPADTWTPQEIEDIVDDYNLEQEIKRAQDTADTYNRMAKYSLDDTNKANYTARAKGWEQRVSDLQWKRMGATPPVDTPTTQTFTPATTYFKPIPTQELVSDGFSIEDVGIINKRFESLDAKYGARVESVRTTIAVEQEQYDLHFKNYVEKLKEDNPTMRTATAEKKTRELLGERPTETSWAVGGYFNEAPFTITLNGKAINASGTIEDDIARELRRAERAERKRAQGKTVYARGNVAMSREATFIHEYGHALDDTYGIATDRRFLDFYRSLTEEQIEWGVSSYAATNELEFIAECFLDSFMGETQGEISKQFMKIADEIIRSKNL